MLWIETLFLKLLGLFFGFFKQEKLLLENGERGILVSMGSVTKVVTDMGCGWFVMSRCSFAALPSAWWDCWSTSSSPNMGKAKWHWVLKKDFCPDNPLGGPKGTVAERGMLCRSVIRERCYWEELGNQTPAGNLNFSPLNAFSSSCNQALTILRSKSILRT